MNQECMWYSTVWSFLLPSWDSRISCLKKFFCKIQSNFQLRNWITQLSDKSIKRSRCIANWQVMVLAHYSKCELTNCVPKITSFSLEKSAPFLNRPIASNRLTLGKNTPSTTKDPFKKLTVQCQPTLSS